MWKDQEPDDSHRPLPERPLSIRELLLAEEPRFGDIPPQRGGWKLRPPIDFDESDSSFLESQNPHPSRKRHD
jgi:hypothetical protein